VGFTPVNYIYFLSNFIVYLSFQIEEMMRVLNKENSNLASSLSDKLVWKHSADGWLSAKYAPKSADYFLLLLFVRCTPFGRFGTLFVLAWIKLLFKRQRLKLFLQLLCQVIFHRVNVLVHLPNLVIRHLPMYCVVEKLTMFLELKIV